MSSSKLCTVTAGFRLIVTELHNKSEVQKFATLDIREGCDATRAGFS